MPIKTMTTITVYTTVSNKQAADKLARSERRSLSEWLAMLIEREIAAYAEASTRGMLSETASDTKGAKK